MTKQIAKTAIVLGGGIILMEITKTLFNVDGVNGQIFGLIPWLAAASYATICYLDGGSKLSDIDKSRRRQNIIEDGFRKGYSKEQIEYLINRVENME